MKKVYLPLLLFTGIVFAISGRAEGLTAPVNVIAFQQIPYGLIFTDIGVNGTPLLAMIDIGDQQTFQLATAVAGKLGLPLNKTGYQATNINGDIMDVYQGKVASLSLGTNTITDMPFTTSPGDIEAVAEQIATDFSAVIGWGYLKDYIVELDYVNSVIRLHNDLPATFKPTMSEAYSDTSGPLILPVLINGEVQRVMLNTGATVSVFDPKQVEMNEDNPIEFALNGRLLSLTGYEMDLSVLSDLGIVGILGSDFLNQYKVVINPKSHKMHFLAYDE
ncbi:retroviral-like aspartic protease family protein [Alteromonas lipolytica]|uniref:Peptidase A2 domain-containing protein n=1 Tax=Alteromonas lipolytica TaxID=1856405 RepID=A0A1E8FE08_9ALTE|nr:retroviral-like aspartic protease family protein [Alteromonas lipolytica]OFI33713.1 hypothetical protein BFC17_19235 [Alteromonas lipolytica]GGF69122.1 hypothetical protein GCM10011338_21580 [Alteromonas lipolytica]